MGVTGPIGSVVPAQARTRARTIKLVVDFADAVSRDLATARR
jgi:hypothetical protein